MYPRLRIPGSEGPRADPDSCFLELAESYPVHQSLIDNYCPNDVLFYSEGKDLALGEGVQQSP